MGLFDKIKESFEKQQDKSEMVERWKIDSEVIDEMQKIPASDAYRNKIYKKYYKFYPEKPFISLDREKNTNWLEQANLFSEQSIVSKKMMTRFRDGLLPGHIYMLYWIGKNKAKRVPAYFEYKYGIEFEKEKQFLVDNGYLLEDKPTSKGADAIVAHFEIIEEHSPKAASAKKAETLFANTETISIAQNKDVNDFEVGKIHVIDGRNLMLVAEKDKAKIVRGFDLINELLSEARKKLKIKETLIIPQEEIFFNSSFRGKLYTYFEYSPLTPKGKKSKFPFELYIASKDYYEAMPKFSCHGNIGYLIDNRIGSVYLHFWYKDKGYHISCSMREDMLSITKIEQSIKGETKVIYKK